jgi:hypothetical protein
MTLRKRGNFLISRSRVLSQGVGKRHCEEKLRILFTNSNPEKGFLGFGLGWNTKQEKFH